MYLRDISSLETHFKTRTTNHLSVSHGMLLLLLLLLLVGQIFSTLDSTPPRCMRTPRVKRVQCCFASKRISVEKVLMHFATSSGTGAARQTCFNFGRALVAAKSQIAANYYYCRTYILPLSPPDCHDGRHRRHRWHARARAFALLDRWNSHKFWSCPVQKPNILK